MRASLVFSAILLALAGCGGGSSSQKVLKWGADPSGGAPFVFFDPNDVNKVIGFEIDMMDKLAAHMGVKHELVRSQWENLLESMKAKRCDMVMNGIEINAERQKRFAFSKPYYVYEQMLVVRAADKDKYKTLEDLKGQKIGTLSGAESNNVLKRAGWTDELLKSYEDSNTPYEDLLLGRTEAVLQEQMIAEYYAGRNDKLYLIPKTFSPGKYGVALRQEDQALLAEIDRILDLMKQNGELAAIYKKWKIWNEHQKEVGVLEAGDK
ncbi:MAG: ABC transporter substrate-binding protein [Planctomycetota bacterium]